MKSSNLLIAVLLLGAPLSSLAAEQVTSYAKNSGHVSCLSTVQDLESFFAKDENYGSWAFVSKEKSDDQVVNASLEITYDVDSALIDFTVAPTKDGKCSYTYTRTFYSTKSCMATTKEGFMKEAEYKTELNKRITAFDDDGAKILLMPVGNGCLVQKKEIGYRHADQAK